ncbi:hypothetical protein N8Z70_03030 [Candidatus Puniceispirillum sp.]|jgi:hypothetical protein|nr:hypothetical protein [bacterium]MDC0649409.1 hypothetical protein [Alphaproteobacteria bacterium]MDC1293996.1 hypothetical protein [Candidatus Puniceispirillum sp.]
MPYFSVFGRLGPERPIYDGKATPPDFSSRQAICAYPKSLFGIFINPAFHRFGKFRKIMADGFHLVSPQSPDGLHRQVTKD